jgi:CHAT domain-containing protein
MLSGETDADGYLSTAQVQRDARLAGTELVFLSACESGTGHTEARARDEYAGIDGAFMAAGARATVSTLWEVDDLAALLFSAAFYSSMRGGASLAVAYRSAVDYLRLRRFDEGLRDPLRPLLDEVAPDWRTELKELQREGIDFAHPFYWSPFKLGGLTSSGSA